MDRIERPPLVLVLVLNPEEGQGWREGGQGIGGVHKAARSYPVCARSYSGMWFEILLIISIHVSKIDIIFIFCDIIHYICQIQTLFLCIRHYLSKLVWNWDNIWTKWVNWLKIGLNWFNWSKMGKICSFVANHIMSQVRALLDIIYWKQTLVFQF